MPKKIFILDSKWNNICWILSTPSKESTEIVLLCHWLTLSKDCDVNVKLTNKLTERNVATFSIDFYGHGESDGEFEDITITKASENIKTAVNYLRDQWFKRIGIMGESFGGLASCIATSQKNDISCLVLKSPVSDYVEVEKRRKTPEQIAMRKEQWYVIHTNGRWHKLKINYSFREDIQNQNAYDIAKKLTMPTFIVHWDADTTVPFEQSQKLTKMIPDCNLEIVSWANHRYTEPGQEDKAVDLIVKFINNLIQKT